MPFFEQQGDDVCLDPEGWRKPHGVEAARARWRAADLEYRARSTVRDDPGDRRLAVQDGELVAAADPPEVLAQASLELGHPNRRHGHKITRNGHEHNAPAASEPRFVTLGLSNSANLLVVVYAYREPDTIRIVSAWKANKRQGGQYDKGRS